MKINWTKWAVFIAAAFLLAACSKGSSSGGASNTMSIKSTDATGAVKVFTATTANSVMSATTNTTDDTTTIQICSDVDADNDCSKLVIMTINGTSAQDYTMDSMDSPNQVVFHDDDATETIINHYVSNGGDINVTQNDGSVVKGNFSTVFECNSGCTGTVLATGYFNIDVSQ